MPLAALVAPVLMAAGVSSTTASLIGAGASVLGSVLSNNGSKGGALGNPAVQAANQAANTQLQMYNQTREDLAPFRSSGASALSQLASIFGFGPGGGGPNAQAAMSQLTQFPGYQFGQQQGIQARDRSAASRGLLLSGAQMKDVTQFGNDYAMQQAWAPYVSGLQWASNLGENAAAQTGTAGANAANGAAAAQLNAGSAGLAQQNVVGGTLQSALSAYQLAHQGGSTPISPLVSGDWSGLNLTPPPPTSVDFTNPLPSYDYSGG